MYCICTLNRISSIPTLLCYFLKGRFLSVIVKMKVFLLQFLHRGFRLIERARQGNIVRHNTTSVKISQRLDTKLERLILKNKLLFYRLLHAVDMIYFTYLGVKIIICCNDLPHYTYIRLWVKGPLRFITGFSMFRMNVIQMIAFRTLATEFTGTYCANYFFNEGVFVKPVAVKQLL